MRCLHAKRSLILKVLVFLCVVWFTVVFLLLRDTVNVSSKLSQLSSAKDSTILVGPPIKRKTVTLPVLPDIIPGVGEHGQPYKLPNELPSGIQALVDQGWKDNAFNQYVSDVISLHRSLPDNRDKYCLEPDRFLKHLPSTSVIIIFHNEAWSVLLRTVHSVLDRSPPELLKEVLLVDDASVMEHLHEALDLYFEDYPKVKIVRAEKREGLIRARLLGADVATGEVLTFLDSHCECAKGWLEPLLDRIGRDPTNVVCPVIDSIDDTTFAYHYSTSTAINVGTFDWGLTFHWMGIQAQEKLRRKDPAEPLRSPTMAGGLFSIDKKFFEKLGRYDNGFDIWGGENLEISFKTWMCGGTLEILPCSHVGHIFRKRSPYSWGSVGNVLRKNTNRLAEVWLDEYKHIYYQRNGNSRSSTGDISDRIAIRKGLNCKSFGWYLENVIPEMSEFGFLAQGRVMNLGTERKLCLDMQSKKVNAPVTTYHCHDLGGNQYFMYSKNRELRRDDGCVDGNQGAGIVQYGCHGQKGNQEWVYDEESKQFVLGTGEHYCLSIQASNNKLVLEKCDGENALQRWEIKEFERNHKE